MADYSSSDTPYGKIPRKKKKKIKKITGHTDWAQAPKTVNDVNAHG